MIPLQGKVEIIRTDEELTVERELGVHYDDTGRPAPGEVVTFGVTCNVQPVEPEELMLQPEGDRAKEQYNLWTENKPGKTKLRLNDIVLRHGKKFQVQEANDWGSYVKARMVSLDVGVDRNPWQS